MSNMQNRLRRNPLSLYEDRRQYHPLGVFRPARSLAESYPAMGERVRVLPGPNSPLRERPYWRTKRSVPMRSAPYTSPTGPLPSWWPKTLDFRPRVLHQARLAPIQYGFMNPDKVIICIKRKIRKEIMHALGMAGNPVSGPHFNAYSHIRC